MSRKKRFWETPQYWKDIKKQDRFLKKLNKAIDKKYFKEVQELIGKPKNKKADWL